MIHRMLYLIDYNNMIITQLYAKPILLAQAQQDIQPFDYFKHLLQANVIHVDQNNCLFDYCKTYRGI